jgi:peptide-methionine (S)-S-oxide reductase
MMSFTKRYEGLFAKRVNQAKWLLACLLLTASVTACARSAPESAAPTQAAGANTATAIFAGGCFWCMEPPYDKLPGVISTTSGYTAGRTANPSYEQVSSGGTGHVEAVEVVYDPAKVSYAKLLEVFWRNIDPTVLNRQFCDVGDMYRSGIYPADDQQRQLAEASKKALQDSGRFPGGVATEIEPASAFYAAEDYHQDYYLKNPVRYKFYRFNCGRDQRLSELWGKAES